ncbi:MAG: HDOD domain-containing protein [Deltaproteobacteria bacterium]|nr:MAG: HDOD domain-containing protein [Deltaproteobacteria bacterium]
MNLVEEALHSVTRLPPFPLVVQQALRLIDDPRASAQEVVDVIQYDQAITANVLKLCNSAYFGLRRTVHSLREALVMIGFSQLLEVILGQESGRFFKGACRGYDLEEGELWRHSVACALLSRIIPKRLNRPATPAGFTAALLHDIGKVILSQYVKDYFGEIRQLMEGRSCSFVEAEKEVLGIDHAELGGKIAEQWQFPDSIVLAIRRHHAPLSAGDSDEIVHLVFLCDLVSLITGIGGGADGLSYHAHGEVVRRYGLEEKDIERFIVELNDQFQEVEDLLDLKESKGIRG